MAADRFAVETPDPDALRMRSFLDGDTHVIELAGKLELTSVAHFERVLRRAELGEAAVIAVDPRKLTFVESTGVRVIVEAQRRTSRAGKRLLVVRASGSIQRLLDIYDVERRLSFVDQLPSGDGASSPRPTRSGTSTRVSQAALAASVRDLRTRRRSGVLR